MKRIFLLLGLILMLTSSCATRVVTTSVAPAQKVVVVKTAPRNHKIVVVKGKRYYFWNGNHYRKTRRGYVLVKV